MAEIKIKINSDKELCFHCHLKQEISMSGCIEAYCVAFDTDVSDGKRCIECLAAELKCSAAN